MQYIDAPVIRYRDGNFNGSLADSADSSLYYLYDANFNVTGLMRNTDAQVVERYMYDPYGKLTVLNGQADADGAVADWSADTSPDASDWGNELLYCGYRRDVETGLYHVRHRYYHPTMGRWVSRDPAWGSGQPNLLLYTDGQPAWHVDPLGLWGTSVHRDDTTRLAGYLCSGDVAARIGAADQARDDREHAAPPIVVGGWMTGGIYCVMEADDLNSHFPGAGPWRPFRRQDYVVQGFQNADVRSALDQALASCDPEGLGAALHMYQDSWSHGGNRPSPSGGHPRKTCYKYDLGTGRWRPWRSLGVLDTRVDDPDENQLEYLHTLDGTQTALEEFASKCPCQCSGGAK